MSVRGEFRRSAGLLKDFVARNVADLELAGALAELEALALENVTAAAQGVERLATEGAFDFAVPDELTEQREERVSHLTEISRIVLGH